MTQSLLFIFLTILCLIMLVAGFGLSWGKKEANSEGEAIVLAGNLIAGSIIFGAAVLGLVLLAVLS